MNYKKIIQSRHLRIKIMQFLSFLPDKFIIELQYKIKTGRKLNLKNPVRYTEKLQWYKLNYKNPILKQCVNKYLVREFVKEKGLSKLLNDCYGIYNSPNEIDYSLLPEKFVCKDTLGGGSTSVVLVDKNNIDFELLNKQMQSWINEPVNTKHPGREWPYDNQKHQIIVEKYLEQSNGDLADYKFFCFNGKTEYFYVRTDYVKEHDNAKMAFFDRNKIFLKNVGMDYCELAEVAPQLSSVIDNMIEYADILSKDFPHVRVDFYDVNGKIIFGELTFYNASGYMNFIPDDFDVKLGEYFKLTSRGK